MVAVIQSENHAANKGKTAGRYKFDTNPTGIGLKINHLQHDKNHFFSLPIKSFKIPFHS